MSRSKRQRQKQSSTGEGSSALKAEIDAFERHLKDLGDLWVHLNPEIQKEFISRKTKAYDAFDQLKKKLTLVLEK